MNSLKTILPLVGLANAATIADSEILRKDGVYAG